MRLIKYKSHKINIYDSIEDMPVTRFQVHNKNIMIDAGVGSDIDDVNKHISMMIKFLERDEKEKCLQELLNLRQNMYLVVSGTSPKMNSFASLVHSIDGKAYEDLSDEGLKRTLEAVNKTKFPVGMIWELVEEVKKKLNLSLIRSFRNFFRGVKLRLSMLLLESKINSFKKKYLKGRITQKK